MVIAWKPLETTTRKHVYRLKQSVVELVEWAQPTFEPCARIKGAYNVVTGEVMPHGLGDDALEYFEEVVLTGTVPGRTPLRLSELRRIGGYDRALLLAYVRMSRHSLGAERLKRILDRFEQQ